MKKKKVISLLALPYQPVMKVTTTYYICAKQMNVVGK
jgi:hypothetical protein